MTTEEHNAGIRNLMIAFMLLALVILLGTLGLDKWLFGKPQEKKPEPETQKNYQAPLTRYTTEGGFRIDRVVIGTDTLYCSHDYKTIIHK